MKEENIVKVQLSVELGGLSLKNPLICGSGEHLMTASGIRAAIGAGAAAVVAKSTNESAAARNQLDCTDYLRMSSMLETVDWHDPDDTGLNLLGRSGLVQRDPREWLDQLAELDAQAAKESAYVVGSLIPADIDNLLELAEYAAKSGLRVLEVNVGAPHAHEAAERAIVLERNADRVRDLFGRVRQVFDGALWAKLTGMSEDVTALALAAKEGGADAVVMIGRSMAMLPDLETHKPALGTNAAYGGRWALPITCRWLAEGRAHLGRDFPLIGTNGARDGYDIARMMLAGAHAVEVCSVVMVNGFGAIGTCLADLQTHLSDKKLDAQALIGRTADRLQTYAEQAARPGLWQSFVPPESVD